VQKRIAMPKGRGSFEKWLNNKVIPNLPPVHNINASSLKNHHHHLLKLKMTALLHKELDC
jgi:hypothetical protein